MGTIGSANETRSNLHGASHGANGKEVVRHATWLHPSSRAFRVRSPDRMFVYPDLRAAAKPPPILFAPCLADIFFPAY